MTTATIQIAQQWKVRVHPFGGGYCVARIGADGRTEHLLSRIGAAPQIQSFYARSDAQTEADRLNAA